MLQTRTPSLAQLCWRPISRVPFLTRCKARRSCCNPLGSKTCVKENYGHKFVSWYRRGLPIPSLFVLECSFHVGYKWSLRIWARHMKFYEREIISLCRNREPFIILYMRLYMKHHRNKHRRFFIFLFTYLYPCPKSSVYHRFTHLTKGQETLWLRMSCGHGQGPKDGDQKKSTSLSKVVGKGHYVKANIECRHIHFNED